MRLIDGNYLYDELKSNGIENMYLGSEVLKMVKEEPTIEAIPKADYENRLKADMVAMLTEIQLELDEMKVTKVRSAGFAPYSKDPFRRGVNCSKEIIQQKIDSLKENENGNK